jgi:hypothetical protein
MFTSQRDAWRVKCLSERGVHVAALGELETRPSGPPRAVHVIQCQLSNRRVWAKTSISHTAHAPSISRGKGGLFGGMSNDEYPFKPRLL